MDERRAIKVLLTPPTAGWGAAPPTAGWGAAQRPPHRWLRCRAAASPPLA